MYNAGDFDTTETVNIPFNTFDSKDPSASVTVTDLVAGDLKIYKDGGVTERSSAAGVTVSVNFDGITGNHMAHIDLSDNTDAGFYANGSRYLIRMNGVTIYAATVNAFIGGWSVGCLLRPTTAGRTLDVTATGEAGIDLDNTVGTLAAAQIAADAITAAKVAADVHAEAADAVWDEVLTGATHNIASSAGRRLRNVQDFGIYDMASVWVDEVAGTSTGTTDGEDATVANRADDFDNAQTVAASVGLDNIHVQNGNTITLAATLNGYNVWSGSSNQPGTWTLALGGQDIGASTFSGATISGTGTGTLPKFRDCHIGTATLSPCTMQLCVLDSTLTVGSAGAYRLHHCLSGVAGASAPTIDMGAAVGATTLELRDWRGGITLSNLASGDVVTLDGMFGTITLNGADASVEIRGTYKALTNNLTGSPTVNTDGAIRGAEIGTAGDGLTGIPWNAAWDAEVESEVNDALDTAIAELAQGVPTATPTLRTGLMLGYMALRNKLVTQTSGTDALEIYDDAGTKIAKKLLTDASGDYTEAKMTSGA